MRIFRFDPEVSVPVSRFGSNFRIGPLTGSDSRVRVQVMHLPADGLVGHHPAVVPQLFAVVAGSGWVSGADGERRPVRPGEAALWDAGEDHESGSDEGMTAVVIEGDFDVWALGRTTDIAVVDHDPEWADWFRTLHDLIWPAVEDLALRIDHVGSTSVPGLAAKPTIDMDIVVAHVADAPGVVARLAEIGYRWRGDLGVEGREAFRLLEDDGRPPHNLYLVVEGNRAHLDHLLLRDLLREDPDARERYAAVKRESAASSPGDIDAYLAGKAPLVDELLARARAERGLT